MARCKENIFLAQQITFHFACVNPVNTITLEFWNIFAQKENSVKKAFISSNLP
jgi:hypothetical protein